LVTKSSGDSPFIIRSQMPEIYRTASHLKKNSPEEALGSIRSAYRILEDHPDTSWRIKFLKLESDIHFKLGDNLKSLELARQGLQKNQLLDDELTVSDLMYNIGRAGFRIGRLDLGLEMLIRATDIYRRLDCEGQLASTHILIGKSYRRLSEIPRATHHFYRALSIYEEMDDLAGVSSALNNIGIIDIMLNNTREARDAFQRVLSNRQQLEDRKGVAEALNNLGLVHLHCSRHSEAMECYRESLSIKREIHDRKGMANTLNNMGNVFNDMGEFDHAMSSYEEALEIKEKIGDRAGMARTLSNMGDLLFKLHRLDDAVRHLTESLQISRELSDTELMTINYGILYAIEKSREDFREALAYLKLKSQLMESVMDRDVERIVAEKKIVYAADRIEKDNEILRLKNEELSCSNRKLQDALRQISELSGLMPICPKCRRIRNDSGFWEEVEQYFIEHSAARFTHGLCPECIEVYYEGLRKLQRDADGMSGDG